MFGDVGAVIACKPNLVHAVVEADDAVFRDDAPHVAHQALRRDRKAVLVGAIGNVLENAFAQRQQRAGIRQLAFELVGKELQTRSEIADNLAMRDSRPARRWPACS